MYIKIQNNNKKGTKTLKKKGDWYGKFTKPITSNCSRGENNNIDTLILAIGEDFKTNLI
jgi:hypothetical protein